MASTKNLIGKRYESNNFGFFTVIDEAGYGRTMDKLFKIKFDNTGSTTIASYVAIRHGRVRDKYAPVVAGVGYTGSFDGRVSDPNIIRFYSAWNDMLHRCYDINDADYPLYGALGATVDKSWFDFGVYFNDIQKLPGFDLKCKYPDLYQLDKDYLQMHLPKSKRVYSKNTCIWISKHDNIMLMNIDYGTNLGYTGIVARDGGYCVRYMNKSYGKYTDAKVAASAFNNLYPMLTASNPYANIFIPNDVPYMHPSETVNYLMNPKEMCKIIKKP